MNNNSRWPKALDESLPEIELYSSARERNEYENMATLYAIIIATEHLERAYAQDAITQQEYVTECQKLLTQFRIAEKELKTGMTTEGFMEIYQMDCPRAVDRLLRVGVPEPIKTTAGGDAARAAVTVAETVQHFITTMDAVRLDQRAVDELQPLLSDLMNALVQIPDTPNDFAPNDRVKRWLERLNAMRAVDVIDEEDARQLSHDLESAYSEFSRFLKART